MKPWSEVEQSKQYQSLSPQEQDGAKKEYWDTVVTQKKDFQSLPQRDREMAQMEFFGKEVQSQAPEGWRGKVDQFLQGLPQQAMDMGSKAPFMGGMATAGLQPTFEALRSPGVRDMASKTAIPLTATMTGSLPAYLGYMGAEKLLPRPSENPMLQKGIQQLPEQMGVNPMMRAAMLAQPQLSGMANLLESPQKGAEVLVDLPRELAKMGIAGGVQGAWKQVRGGFLSANSKAVRLTNDDIAKLKVQGVDIKDKATLAKLQAEKAKIVSLETQKANNRLMSKKLEDSLYRETPQLKQSFKDYTNSFNTSYGKELDSISNSIGKKITRKEASVWIRELVGKLKNNPDYANTKAINRIESLGKKLGDKGIKSPILDARGKPIITKTADSISFKDLNSEVKATLQGRTYNGTTTVEDLVYDELRHGYGDFVGRFDTSGSFKALQADASQKLNFKRYASKVFQPNSEYDTKKIENILIRNANGKASAGEKKLLEEIRSMAKQSGIDISGVESLAKDVASGSVKLAEINAKAKLVQNKIKEDLVKQLSPIKKEQISKAALLKDQKPTGMQTAGRVLGKAVDLIWRISIYRMLGGIGRG